MGSITRIAAKRLKNKRFPPSIPESTTKKADMPSNAPDWLRTGERLGLFGLPEALPIGLYERLYVLERRFKSSISSNGYLKLS